MAYIKVDHSKFDAAYNAVGSYTIQVALKGLAVENSVSSLKSSWKGDDYTVFENQWRKAIDKESTYKKYLDMMSHYADALKIIGNKYKDAQANAVNRSNDIPTWF